MNLFDTHCHLDFPDYEADLESVFSRAHGAGVHEMLTIGTCLSSSRQAVELAKAHEGLYAAVGVHPNHCHECGPNDLRDIAELAKDPVVVAIGETGLDFFRDHCEPALQESTFLQHLEWAVELDKPIVLHSRESGERLLEILEPFMGAHELRGVFHCFTASKEILQRALDLGLKIGISGIATFPKGDNVRELIPMIPDDQLLLDSDSPFLAPVPHRGKRNEPGYLPDLVKCLAEVRGVSSEDIARITTRNARELFLKQRELSDAKVAYVIRNSLYLALTNACTNDCSFCARNQQYRVKGHNIHLDHEPETQEVIDAMGDTSGYDEVCFCGFGEPTMRLETLCGVADELKRRGVRVRLNTNGQGNLFHGRNIVPDLVGRIDSVSISLNSADPHQYQELCNSRYGEQAAQGVWDFVRLAVTSLPEVVCSVVDMPGIDVEAARKKTEELGAIFRVRSFVDVG